MMSLSRLLLLALVAPALLWGGCDEVTSPSPGDRVGTLRLALGGPVADVAGLYYVVDCDGVVYTQYVPLEAEGLPDHIDPTWANASFGDLFLTVPEGTCDVTVTPMQSPGVPSVLCQPTSATVTVVAGATTEEVLVIQCDSPDPGGIDIVTVVNEAPVVTELQVHPALSVPGCTPVTVTVVAADPESAPLSYDFVVSGPSDTYGAEPSGAQFRLTAGEKGNWRITARVSDGFVTTDAIVNIVIEDTAVCL